MTLIELMFLILLLFLAVVLGNCGAKYVGWIAWVPAFVLGAVATWVAVASLVREVRQSVAILRGKFLKNK